MPRLLCDKCGGNLVKDEYTSIYTCDCCGQKWYFKKDFAGDMEEEE